MILAPWEASMRGQSDLKIVDLPGRPLFEDTLCRILHIARQSAHRYTQCSGNAGLDEGIDT